MPIYVPRKTFDTTLISSTGPPPPPPPPPPPAAAATTTTTYDIISVLANRTDQFRHYDPCFHDSNIQFCIQSRFIDPDKKYTEIRLLLTNMNAFVFNLPSLLKVNVSHRNESHHMFCFVFPSKNIRIIRKQ